MQWCKEPKMNKKQKIVLWLGIIAFVFVSLFPPVIIEGLGPIRGIREYERGFGCLLDPLVNPFLKETIDFPLLAVEWIVIAVVTGGFLITFKDTKKQV